MRTSHYMLIILAILTAGCTSLELPSTLRPASHAYAEPLSSWSDFDPLPNTTPNTGTPMKRAEQLQLRRLLRQQLFALKGRRSIGRHNRTGLGLIQRVYGQYDLASRPQNAPSADALWRRTDAINGQAAPGDILFFTGDHQTPSLGIARRVLDNGVIEFATYQGGRVQFLRCDPKHPDTRRSRGHILNSFIRTKKPSDRPRSRYLAGQYLVGIRTPFK